VLGCPVGTVKTHVLRAKDKLPDPPSRLGTRLNQTPISAMNFSNSPETSAPEDECGGSNNCSATPPSLYRRRRIFGADPQRSASAAAPRGTPANRTAALRDSPWVRLRGGFQPIRSDRVSRGDDGAAGRLGRLSSGARSWALSLPLACLLFGSWLWERVGGVGAHQ